MPYTFANWTSRVAIAARVAELRRQSQGNETMTFGDYHLPFGKAEARAEAARRNSPLRRPFILASTLLHFVDNPAAPARVGFRTITDKIGIWPRIVSLRMIHNDNRSGS